MLQRVFVPEPFATPEIISIILASPIEGEKLKAEGLALSERILPIAYENTSERTPGLLLDLNSEEDQRIDYIFKALGYTPKEINIAGLSALVYLGDAAESGNDTFDAKLQADFLRAVFTEVMGYYGRLDVSDITWRLAMIKSRAWSYALAQTPFAAEQRSARQRREVECEAEIATHEGFFLTRTYTLRHPRFEGGMSPDLKREVFVVGEAALVLPYDPLRDRILLVELYRLGPYGRGDVLPWVLEPVAGRVDAGETPENAARRECVEEAGLELKELTHINTHYCSPGCSTEMFHCYLGLCDLPDAVIGHGGLETEHEDIRTHVISFAQAQSLMQSGEINIGPLYLMLLWLERERDKLRGKT